MCAIGFTEHASQDFDRKYSIIAENLAKYRADIAAARKAHGDRIRIYAGLERDIWSTGEYGWCDYWIGSEHYFRDGDEASSADVTEEVTRYSLEKYFGGNWEALAAMYFTRLAAFVRAKKPPIIGHADLFTKTTGDLIDMDHPSVRSAEADLLLAARDAGAVFEVNTKAWWKGITAVPYPSARMLRAWRRMGGQVILSSDAHSTDQLCAMYPEAREYLCSIGYTEELRLGGIGEPLFVRQDIR